MSWREEEEGESGGCARSAGNYAENGITDMMYTVLCGAGAWAGDMGKTDKQKNQWMLLQHDIDQ